MLSIKNNNCEIKDLGLPKKYEKYNIIDEELVEVTEYSGILVDLQYPKLKMKNAINKCYVRKTVLDKLIIANNNLPDGLVLKIWDAYRPIELQKELYTKYKDQIIKNLKIEDLDENEKNEIIKNFVSEPSLDYRNPPLHITGGSVDVTLTDKKTKKDLDLGVSFDEFSNLTYSSSFEKEGMNEEIRNNRRILYNAMISAGFTNLPSEIWHYDYGNRNWAYYKNNDIMYIRIDI